MLSIRFSPTILWGKISLGKSSVSNQNFVFSRQSEQVLHRTVTVGNDLQEHTLAID